MADETDLTEKSVPKDGKINVCGRSVLIKRVPLGQRLRLARIFSAGLASVLKDQVDAGNIDLVSLMKNLPAILGTVELHWKDIINIATDITIEEVERDGELEDLVRICKAVFETNRFMDSMQNLGKVVSGIQLGSKSNSPTLAESVAGPSKTS